MFFAAARAFSDLLDGDFRGVFWKSIGLTLFVLIVAFFGAAGLIRELIEMSDDWLEAILEIVAAFGVILGLIYLAPPVVSLVASFFLDEIAETVERKHYSKDPPGREPPVLPSLATSAQFFILVAIVNAFALLLILIPGVNLFVFFIANGYLIGREYFERAAFRHHSPEDARALRKRHATTVFLAGLIVAGLLAIPIVNLVAPLFAASFMTHLHKILSRDVPYRTIGRARL